MALSHRTLNNLAIKLKLLQKARPFSPSVLAKIREKFEVEMTYNSNAIEGNSLTLKETYWVLREGITVKDKPLKDHLEAKNHLEALDFLFDFVSEKNVTISEHVVRQFHQLVVMDSQRDIAGKYRDGEVYISGAKHSPPPALEIQNKMRGLIKWWINHEKKLHPIELAALLHHKFVAIHPFWDGNGRTGRLLMNIVVLRAGYPLAIILKNDRKRYYRTLAEADEGKEKPLSEFIAQAVLRSLTVYLKVLSPKYSRNERLLRLNELSKKSPYSATYLRKLALTGQLEAVKQGRNWFSSELALQSYLKSLKNSVHFSSK